MKYKLINPINQNYSAIEQVLTNRGIPLNEISHYLHTSDNDINPPEDLGQDKLLAAAAVLIKTIKSDFSTLVIIDSDADGFTSSALLLNYLHDLFPAWVESKVEYVLHSGKQHGLNDYIDNLLECNYALVIIPDAGKLCA